MKKLNIIALISHPYFNLFESLYESCKNDEKFNVVIVVYEAIKLSNSTALFKQTFKFLEAKKIPFINAMQGEDYIDLKQFKPDVIFLQIPYQTYRPEKYSDLELSKFTNLAHISYGAMMYDTINSKEYKGLLTLNSLWKVAYKLFAPNHFDANFVTQNNILKKSQVAVIGDPKVEKVLKQTKITSKKQAIENLNIRPFKIAWKPRWHEELSFETYQKYIIDFISQNPSIELIFIAHPLTRYREKLKALSLPNVKIVEDGDFLSEILSCNIFIGDNCSTTYEFFLTRKPVIECINNVLPSPLAIKMKSGFYSVSNVDELQFVLNDLLSGKDELFEARKQIADEVEFVLPIEFKTYGDYIKSILLRDFGNKFNYFKITLTRKIRFFLSSLK